ncbi:unnamed protein product [Prorocentrum cordatum]|uniref:Uncharacterized protein n=1 Tax=Prorocentrum cordatum TaxID=2364126 RepID=A0ABN9SX48_9DINO|nr:unnamed protein product [Polarella glacialis]
MAATRWTRVYLKTNNTAGLACLLATKFTTTPGEKRWVMACPTCPNGRVQVVDLAAANVRLKPFPKISHGPFLGLTPEEKTEVLQAADRLVVEQDATKAIMVKRGPAPDAKGQSPKKKSKLGAAGFFFLRRGWGSVASGLFVTWRICVATGACIKEAVDTVEDVKEQVEVVMTLPEEGKLEVVYIIAGALVSIWTRCCTRGRTTPPIVIDRGSTTGLPEGTTRSLRERLTDPFSGSPSGASTPRDDGLEVSDIDETPSPEEKLLERLTEVSSRLEALEQKKETTTAGPQDSFKDMRSVAMEKLEAYREEVAWALAGGIKTRVTPRMIARIYRSGGTAVQIAKDFIRTQELDGNYLADELLMVAMLIDRGMVEAPAEWINYKTTESAFRRIHAVERAFEMVRTSHNWRAPKQPKEWKSKVNYPVLSELNPMNCSDEDVLIEGVEKELRERLAQKALLQKTLDKLADPKVTNFSKLLSSGSVMEDWARTRVRDPLLELAFPPGPAKPSLNSGRSRSRWAQEKSIYEQTCGALVALRSMFKGDLSELEEEQSSWASASSWKRGDSIPRETTSRIGGLHRLAHERGLYLLTPKSAFERLDLHASASSYQNAIFKEKRMLKPPHLVDLEEIWHTQTYMDPNLRSKSKKLELAVDVYEAGILGTTEEQARSIPVFFVMKKVEEGELLLRPVWDMRAVNRFFQALPSPLDPWSSARREGKTLLSAWGDVPDYFHRCLAPPWLRPYMVLDGVSPKELRGELRRRGLPGPSLQEGRFFCLRVMVMGVSWSPAICHNALEDIMIGQVHFPAEGQVAVHEPPPDFRKAAQLYWIYMDDVLNVSLGPPSELGKVEMVREAIPRSKKFQLLITATKFVIDEHRCSPKALSRLNGSWVWVLMCARAGLSIMNATFKFVVKYDLSEQVLPLWSSVIGELKALYYLAPMLRTPLKRSWGVETVFEPPSTTCPRAMGDIFAGAGGFGTAVAEACRCKTVYFDKARDSCHDLTDPSIVKYLERRKAEEGTRLARATARLVQACMRAGIGFSVENPTTSTLWDLPEFFEMRGTESVLEVTLVYCACGARWLKPTRLLTNVPELGRLSRGCPGGHQHQTLRGVAPEGLGRRDDHINVLELQTVQMLGRHLARAQTSWDKKYLVLCDPMVTIGEDVGPALETKMKGDDLGLGDFFDALLDQTKCLGAEYLKGPRREFPPMRKKGALAREMARNESHYTDRANSDLGPFPMRLLVHAVNDETNVSYLKEAESLLMEVLGRRLPFGTPEESDITVASFLDRMCFADQLPLGRGEKAFPGLLHVFPEWRGSMPVAARARTAWERWSATREGGPASRSTIYFIAAKCIEKSFVDEGLAFVSAFDAYLREQDWLQLRYDEVQVALLLGRRHRGESVKTGQEQGVALDDQFLCSLLWARSQTLRPNEKVSHANQTRAGRVWRQVLHENKLEFAGPMHTLRHSGPSEDVPMKRRSLTDAQRRGRWSQAKAVQRYAKPRALIAHQSQVPEDARRKGEQYQCNVLAVLRRVPPSHRWRPAVLLCLQKDGGPSTER